jgi:large subunit ribosomal protein L24
MHVKKGDMVQVISGNDRGRTGEVKEAFPQKQRVLVEGINMRWRHRKPTQQNPKGERVQVALPIHASNVKLHVAASPASPTKAAKEKAAKAVKTAGAEQESD